jgi:hypothetical protein
MCARGTATAPPGTAARGSAATAIIAGGIEKDVHFEDADPALNDAIDAVYRSKYLRHGKQWVDPMVAAEAHSTTIKLVPR